MRFLVLLILSTYLCCDAYGQDVIYFSCDEYPNIPEASRCAFEEIAAKLNEESADNTATNPNEETCAQSSNEESDETAINPNEETSEENFNTHLINMNFIASIVWECSEDAHQFNSSIEHALNIYFRQPRIREYIYEFLGALSYQYNEVETYNEENNTLTRATGNAFWTIGAPYLAYRGARRLFGRRLRFLNLSSRQSLAVFGLGGTTVATVPAAASEYLEDDVTIKINPSVINEALFVFEAYNLAHFSHQLNEDIKTADITNEATFNEYALKHKNLRDAYGILRAQRPGLFNPRNHSNQNICLPPQLREGEIYEGSYQLFPDDLMNSTCQDSDIADLNLASCQLRESANILNNSSFSNDPIRFELRLEQIMFCHSETNR